jgi:hypothetical protein
MTTLIIYGDLYSAHYDNDNFQQGEIKEGMKLELIEPIRVESRSITVDLKARAILADLLGPYTIKAIISTKSYKPTKFFVNGGFHISQYQFFRLDLDSVIDSTDQDDVSIKVTGSASHFQIIKSEMNPFWNRVASLDTDTLTFSNSRFLSKLPNLCTLHVENMSKCDGFPFVTKLVLKGGPNIFPETFPFDQFPNLSTLVIVRRHVCSENWRFEMETGIVDFRGCECDCNRHDPSVWIGSFVTKYPNITFMLNGKVVGGTSDISLLEIVSTYYS